MINVSYYPKKKPKGTEIIKNSSSETLLEIVDNQLRFEDHVSNLCRKTRQRKNVREELLWVLTKDPVIAQFSYCPLIWMLATDIYKFKNNLSPDFMNKIFTERTHPYNISKDITLQAFNVKTILYST